VSWQRALSRLRVLIVHAGGDARRLPVYSPAARYLSCARRVRQRPWPYVLDRQLPDILLPAAPEKTGQVIVTSGDVFLDFDSSRLRFDRLGITAVGCLADPKLASAHGVFCPAPDGGVRKFLQKPSIEDQDKQGAIDRHGRSVLTWHHEPGLCGRNPPYRRLPSKRGRGGRLAWSGRAGRLVQERGLDFYREICCALGRDTDSEATSRKSAGPDRLCLPLSSRFSTTLFHPSLFRRDRPACIFLHFGTLRQLMESGADLISLDKGTSNAHAPIILNSEVEPGGASSGRTHGSKAAGARRTLSWRRKCRRSINIDRRLALPQRACLDVLEG